MKRFKFKLNPITNNQGQGALEYILLLIISVSVIVGILLQFNQSFAEYTENYFGQYLRCLLVSGELPNLGVEQNGASAASCDASFKAFSLAEGRPPNSNSNNSSNSTSDGKGKKNSPTSFSSNAGRSGGGSSRGRSGAGRGFGGGSSNNRFSANKRSGKKPKDKIVEGAGASSRIGSLKNNDKNESESSDKKKNRVTRVKAFDPKKEKKKSNQVAVNKIKNEDNKNQSKKSFRMAASLKKATPPDIDSGFSFGDYLRYIIIAAILIVLIFIVGGQIFQATKGKD